MHKKKAKVEGFFLLVCVCVFVCYFVCLICVVVHGD